MSWFGLFKKDPEEFVNSTIRAYYAYTIFKDEGIMLLVYLGAPTVDEMIKVRIEIAHHPDFKTSNLLLTDFRNSIIEAEQSEIDDLIKYQAEHPEYRLGHSKHAIIITNKRDNELVQYYGLKAREVDLQVGVFYDLESALNWLGKPSLEEMVDLETKSLYKRVKPIV